MVKPLEEGHEFHMVMLIQMGCETGFPAMRKAMITLLAERFSRARGSNSIQRFHQYIISPMESQLIPAIRRLNDEVWCQCILCS